MAISPIGMANMAYWNVLPMGISNYGGDVQVYNVGQYAQPFFTAYNPLAMQSFAAPFMGGGCILPMPPLNLDFMA